jgi:hypothetical protein
MLHMLLTRLWIQITADRKRFAALCAVLAIGLLLWSRIILISRAPKVAVAEQQPNSTTATGKSATGSGKSTAKPTGKGARKPAGKPGEALATTPSDKPLPIVAITLDRNAQRDPFRISERYFPRPNILPDNRQEAAKSLVQPSDDAQGAQERLEAQLHALAARFQLEAVMQGGPMAIINGRTYRLGEEVPAVDAPDVRFRLTEVRPLAVTLTCAGRQFELRMPGPKIAPR